jgi:hypothetical protein
MGFHKRSIPDLQTLKDIYSKCETDEEFFQKVVGKSDAVTGSPESIFFLDEIYERMEMDNEGRREN